jgi:N6-adenosine-specific RNA methylase IME4
MTDQRHSTIIDLAAAMRGRKFHTVLADPPWRFVNRTGKMAPEHRRLSRYQTMTTEDICALPVSELMAEPAHLYLWVPNALLPEGLRVMAAWGFDYKSNIVTELLLFGVRGKNARTLAPGRRQVNMIETRKREHSRKPDEQYAIIEACSKAPYLELFARGTRKNWTYWGNQAHEGYKPTWETYAHNSAAERMAAE